jgi:Ca2+-transporting ATPase
MAKENQVSMWHALGINEAAERQGVSLPTGLDDSEAAARLRQFGHNELSERAARSPWSIIWGQLTGTLVVILILAALVSAGIGIYDLIHSGMRKGWEEIYDAIAIAVIVIMNTILGFLQEYRAERAMAALKKLSVPTVRVRRGGSVRELPATDLAPGDVVLLEAGSTIPADGRLVEAVNLRLQEAALTGESEPVEKSTQVIPGDNVPLGDRRNMAYMGTVATYGRGTLLITETGMGTQLGAIATMIQAAPPEATPLQRRLEQLGKVLAITALVLVAIIFTQGLIRGGLGFENIKKMFLIGISMAVAAVPEGLPAVVTIALALGAQRMLRRRALIRKLMAVETLGSVTVICSDKTGTLTENRMTVSVIDVAGDQLDLREHLTRARIDGQAIGESPRLKDQPGMAVLLAAGALCNDAILQKSAEASGRFTAMGDPTEGALVVAAAELGLAKNELEEFLPRVSELPFDSDRKRMTTVHRLAASGRLPAQLTVLAGESVCLKAGQHVAFVKGAVDGLLSICTGVLEQGRMNPLDEAMRRRITMANDALAQKGMRVLGVAMKLLGDESHASADTESRLTFVGLVGMIDPPRAEVKQAVATCRTAGIRPVMITGDHPLTAWHIAQELGIADGGKMLTGADLDKLSVEDLKAQVERVGVYARVSPEHKLKIVQALKQRGHVVAMTGDGVNDAPALKKADIGVAMGITGTDVSKEASNMVLLDDNFATIVAAVEEGRVIYDNIRKFIRYLLATNSGEIWVMFLAPLLGMPIPLIPLQILWINLVTDGLPALALGVEPPERNIMRRRPHDPKASILGGGLGVHVIWVGLLMAALCLIGGEYSWLGSGGDSENHEQYYRTVVFTIVTLTQMANVLAIRSGTESLFRAGLLSNKPLLGAVSLTILLQLAIIYTPWLQGFFKTVPLSAKDLLIATALSAVVFVAVEIEKVFFRRKASYKQMAINDAV